MAGIWIFSEKVETAKRLITLGIELKQALRQPLRVFCFQAETGLEYIDCGADESMILRENLSYTISYSQSMIQLALQENPSIFLLDDTVRGRDLAEALAARVRMHLVHDVLLARYEEDTLLVKRKIQGDGLFFTGRQGLPAVITLETCSYQVTEDKEHSGRLIHMPQVSGVRAPV